MAKNSGPHLSGLRSALSDRLLVLLVTASFCCLLAGCVPPEEALRNEAPHDEYAESPESESDEVSPPTHLEPDVEAPSDQSAAPDSSPSPSVNGAGSSSPSQPPPRYPRGDITVVRRRIAAGARTLSVTLLDVPLGSVRLRVGLAKDRVGFTEALADIARRHGAIAAINGCFFDAYSKRPVRNPYGTLISGGQMLCISDHPTTLGVWPDGSVHIGQVTFKLRGDSGHHEPWYRSWYAYSLNKYPEADTCSIVLTSGWCQTTSPQSGLYILVRNGIVEAKGYGSTQIPSDGYVIHLRGAEKQLYPRFEIGARCTYELLVDSRDDYDWRMAREALGCGPLLVRDGKVCVNPQAELFRDPKVLSMACNRSALGLAPDRHLLLVTSSAATIPQLARVMQTLGCSEAMNLDGGASSGLFYRDAYLTRPGRNISNALLVLPQPA